MDYARIAESPRFRTFVRAKRRFNLGLLIVVMGSFFAFAAAIGAGVSALTSSIGAGPFATLGMALSLVEMLVPVLATALYVRHANRVLDREAAHLRDSEA